jgi:tRNA pseudouridine55 synthase
MDGVLVIDKPVGPTSHDVVARVRRALGERRVGHTGTLDPAASGVLPLVMGRATRLARFLSAGDKSYEAIIRLGFSTDTGDATGTPLTAAPLAAMPTLGEIDSALDAFRGVFMQQPPAYSAKKVGGTRSYRLARRSKREGSILSTSPALPAAVQVTVHAADVIGVADDTLALRVRCSAGFYVRALAHDLGERLGTGGHLAGLRRTSSADFTLLDAIPLDLVERDGEAARVAIVPLAATLPALASVRLTAEGAQRASHGRDLRAEDVRWNPVAPGTAPATNEEQWVRLLDDRGELVGIARASEATTVLHPFVVLV